MANAPHCYVLRTLPILYVIMEPRKMNIAIVSVIHSFSQSIRQSISTRVHAPSIVWTQFWCITAALKLLLLLVCRQRAITVSVNYERSNQLDSHAAHCYQFVLLSLSGFPSFYLVTIHLTGRKINQNILQIHLRGFLPHLFCVTPFKAPYWLTMNRFWKCLRFVFSINKIKQHEGMSLIIFSIRFLTGET